MASTPVPGSPTGPEIGALSALSADRVPIANLLTTVLGTAKRQVTDKIHRFWSSSAHTQFTGRYPFEYREVLELTFGVERIINYISMSIAHFPHTITAQYYNAHTRTWQPVRQRAVVKTSVLSNPVTATISDSVPAVIGIAPADPSLPVEHQGIGHWVPIGWNTAQFSTTKVRFILERGPGRAPVDAHGQHEFVPYPLGITDLQVGYSVLAREDVPRTGMVQSETDVFSSTSDYLGSRMQFSLKEDSPKNATVGDASVWRSEPQPVNYAVVNYYADIRDSAGLAQVIDRWYIDPLTVGPHLNLYYSNEEPAEDFEAADEQLPYGAVTITGNLSSTPGYLDLSLDPNASVSIASTVVQFDWEKPWWAAMALAFQFRTNSSGIRNILLVGSKNVLRYNSGVLEWVSTSDSDPLPDLVELGLPTLPVNADCSLIMAYQPKVTDTSVAQGYHLYFKVSGFDPIEVTELISHQQDAHQGNITLGSVQPGFFLNSFVLKQASLTDEDVSTFFDDPYDYPLKPTDRSLPTPNTTNALLRFHPLAITPEYLSGIVGGFGDRYKDLVWSPIQRNYALKRGFMYLPPTKAKYWKFEFTGLIAEPYESFVPIKRTIQMFSSSTASTYAAVAGSGTASAPTSGAGVRALIGQDPVSRYKDAVETLASIEAAAANSKTAQPPTQVLYAHDLSQAAQIAKYGWVWKFQPWHVGAHAPQFVDISKHVYETVEVTHASKIGYFVGLRYLHPVRLDYTAPHDTEEYIEHFYDSQNIVSMANADIKDGWLSARSNYAEASSVIFHSTDNVRGVQLATVQGEPHQLLADDHFSDPSSFLDHWGVYGDADLALTVGQALVQRGYVSRTYGGVEDSNTYASYTNMEGRRYGEFEGGQINGIAGGGVRSLETFDGSSAGRLYAAARVIAADTLLAPVQLQILSTDGQRILASTEQMVSAGETVDLQTSYVPGSVTDTLTWANMETFTYAQLDATQYAAHESSSLTGQVYVQLIQPGPTHDTFSVTALSLFDDPYTWEMSNDGGVNWYDTLDIRNNPDGVMLFPDPSVSVVQKNQCPNPSFEVSTANWAATNGTLTQSTAWAKVGTKSARLAAAGTGNATVLTAINATLVTQGDAYAIQASIKLDSASPSLAAGLTVAMQVAFYDGSNVLVGSVLTGVPVYNTGQVQLITVHGTVPALASHVQYGPVVQNPVSGDILYLDAVRYDSTTQGIQPYADGSTTNWIWSGTVGLSTSSLPLSVAGPTRNQLRWRLRMFDEKCAVSALAIRPWYGNFAAHQLAYHPLDMMGPNRSVVDQYPEIHDDPMWQQWNGGVPRSWFTPASTVAAVVAQPPVVAAPPAAPLPVIPIVDVSDLVSIPIDSAVAIKIGNVATTWYYDSITSWQGALNDNLTWV